MLGDILKLNFGSILNLVYHIEVPVKYIYLFYALCLEHVKSFGYMNWAKGVAMYFSHTKTLGQVGTLKGRI